MRERTKAHSPVLQAGRNVQLLAGHNMTMLKGQGSDIQQQDRLRLLLPCRKNLRPCQPQNHMGCRQLARNCAEK